MGLYSSFRAGSSDVCSENKWLLQMKKDGFKSHILPVFAKFRQLRFSINLNHIQ